jgi:glycosyltransferase involved in cell wall biosynthesis
VAHRILVLNQYFPPDIASTGHVAEAICEALAAAGASVTAIVGQPSYAPGLPDARATESRAGLTIRRIPMGRFRGRRTLAVRLLGYARFLLMAWLETRRQSPPDVLVTFHNPPLLGLLGAMIAFRRRVPFVYIVQDIHPDILARTGSPQIPAPLVAVWRRLSRLMLHSATLVITLSDAMKNYLVRTYGVEDRLVTAIPLWAQPSLEHLADKTIRSETFGRAARAGDRSADDFVVLYAGNMGVMHPVEILVSAAERLRTLPISFVFVGDGAKRPELERLTRDLSLDNVRFMPFQPLPDFERLVQSADVCAVALANGLEDLCWPSRTPTFMSAGKPILAVMSPRATQSRELTETHAGWHTDSVEGVVGLLERLVDSPEQLRAAGRAARAQFGRRYRRDPLVSQYVDVILDLAD